MANEDFDFGAGADFSSALESLSRRTRGLENGAAGFARAMTQAFSRAIVDGRRLDDVLKSLVLRLSDLSLKLALKPLEKSLAGGINSLFAGLFGGGGGGAGGLFKQPMEFADGGVIAAPHYFPLAGGRLGLAGEAGPEAILPLQRGADGRLGVAAAAAPTPTANITIHIATPDAASFRRSEAYVTGLIARAVARGQRSL